MKLLKGILQELFGKFGFRVARIQENYNQLDVLDLAIKYFLLDRGTSVMVQIGANDSDHWDPINKYLEKYRWKALMVEPNPFAFSALRLKYKERSEIKCDNVAIHANESNRTLYVPVREGFDYSGLGSFSKQQVLKERPFFSSIREIIVPCVTFHNCLINNNIVNVDILQIDTEGYDFEVLKQIDFGVIQPRIINYEHVHLSQKDKILCQEYLIKLGYSFYISGLDTLALRF